MVLIMNDCNEARAHGYIGDDGLRVGRGGTAELVMLLPNLQVSFTSPSWTYHTAGIWIFPPGRFRWFRRIRGRGERPSEARSVNKQRLSCISRTIFAEHRSKHGSLPPGEWVTDRKSPMWAQRRLLWSHILRSWVLVDLILFDSVWNGCCRN